MSTSATAEAPRAYRHPPIAEAIIEVRFDQAVAPDRIESAAQRIKANYTFLDPENTVDFRLDPENQKASVASSLMGYRLNSTDRDEIALIRTTAFVCAKLAPYTGWSSLEERARRDWEIWKREVGYAKISRIGLRYINRIDVPVYKDDTVMLEKFLRVYPIAPAEIFETTSNYALQMNLKIAGRDYGLTLNSGSIPSPLVGHASFGLDLDLYCDVNLPQRDDEMWKRLAEMRQVKNEAFESCITDEARELFK